MIDPKTITDLHRTTVRRWLQLFRAVGVGSQELVDLRLQRALESLANRLDLADPEAAEDLAARVDQALAGGLAPTLGRLTRGLSVRDPVAIDDLPAWLSRQFTGLDGTQLIQVFPAVDLNDFDQQRRFTEEVLAVAGPRATGGPVVPTAAGDAITSAFRQALFWAVLGISAVLLLTLRSISQSARVLAPLALGGVLTGAMMVLLDIPFNFANVVALPLLLGVAVDNGIHLVLRHRAGLLPHGNVLQSASARAIVFDALITAGGFGNLAFSPHAGTASLGVVLAVGLALMVIATLVFLPALLAWVLHRTGARLDLATLHASWPLPVAAAIWFLAPLAAASQSWRLLFPGHGRPPAGAALRLTWIGLGVNWLLPVATIGGEVVKYRLGRQAGWAGERLAASLVADKTLQVSTQILYLLIGAALLLGMTGRLNWQLGGLLWLIGFAASVALFYRMQKAGMFSGLLNAFARAGVDADARRTGSRRIDAAIRRVYRRQAGSRLAHGVPGTGRR